MFRLPPSILAAVLMLLPAIARGDDAKDLKIIANVKEVSREYTIGPIVPKGLQTIRSAEELVAASNKPKSAADTTVQKEMTAALAKLLKVDSIDWSKQMVVVGIVEGFDSLKSDGKVLTAIYIRHIQRPARAILSTPKVVALIERFEGEVKFVPKDKDEKKE